MSEAIDLNTIGQQGTIIPPTSSDTNIHPLQDKVAIIKEEIQKLSVAIEANAPEYKEVLFKIDKILRSYKELTYMLEEEEIGIIVAGLQKDSDIQFASNSKSSGGGKVGSGGNGKKKEKIEINSMDDI